MPIAAQTIGRLGGTECHRTDLWRLRLLVTRMFQPVPATRIPTMLQYEYQPFLVKPFSLLLTQNGQHEPDGAFR